MTASSVSVLVVGATGMLGSQIVDALLGRGAAVRALVRPDGDAHKRQALADKGVRLVEGDARNSIDSLARVLDGVEVIVSAVQGGPEVVVTGQSNLIAAGGEAGVRRMIPSDFSVDRTKLDYGDNDLIDLRKRANEAFARSNVQPTPIFNGAFMDVLMAPEMQFSAGNAFDVWGDLDQPCDFTSVADGAAYTAAAALDPEMAGRPLRVAGDVKSMRELHASLERAFGREVPLTYRGDADALRAEIERRKPSARSPMEYVALQYQWVMVTGKGKLDRLDNARYPDIKPVSLDDFLSRHVSAQGAGGLRPARRAHG